MLQYFAIYKWYCFPPPNFHYDIMIFRQKIKNNYSLPSLLKSPSIITTWHDASHTNHNIQQNTTNFVLFWYNCEFPLIISHIYPSLHIYSSGGMDTLKPGFWVPAVSRRNGLKASWTRLFIIFCQKFFAIFDDFSKWSTLNML